MVIEEIQKNPRERITISLDTYKGHYICSVRVFFEVKPGKWVPTKKGIAFSANRLSDIIGALQKAHEELIKNASHAF